MPIPNTPTGPRLGALGRPSQPAPQAPQSEWDRIMANSTGRGRAARAESEMYLGPLAISNDTNQLFTLLAGSPMFQNMMRSIMQQGSQLNTGMQSSLGRTGLSSSGVGAATGGLARSATGNAISGARGELFGQALQTALQALQARMQMAPQFMEERRAAPTILEQAVGMAGGVIPGASGYPRGAR